MRVALVYPPYGPLNLPSLGMAILSAGVKARGFECRTFYWNYQLLEALPQPRREQRRLAYGMLSERSLFPWNEWAFTRYALPAVAHRDDEALARQRMLDETGPPAGGMPPSQLLRHIVEIAPRLVAQMTRQLAPFDVVGIGSTFFQNGAALALARAVKARWPEKLVVLGGANCDGEMGRAQIEAFPFLDCVFVGEVDHAFPEMVERLAGGRPIADTPGILCRGADGAIREGPPSPPLTDLDALPVPDFDDYVAERKRFGLHVEGELCLPLESSRGCWWGAKHHCTFCGLNANGMAFRQKDPERFRREVQETVLRYGARWLFMADNILSAKYYRDFVQWAKQRQLRLDFFYEIKANVTRRQVADLAEAGITHGSAGHRKLQLRDAQADAQGRARHPERRVPQILRRARPHRRLQPARRLPGRGSLRVRAHGAAIAQAFPPAAAERPERRRIPSLQPLPQRPGELRPATATARELRLHLPASRARTRRGWPTSSTWKGARRPTCPI